ncbi:MAG: BCCT family transporter [Dehalobacterium sp.]
MEKILGKIDQRIFWVSAVICLLFVVWAMIAPGAVTNAFSVIFNFTIQNLGWAYMICGVLFLLFCVALAFSKYGKIKLGKDNEEPEYSTASWFAMLFSAGMGIGLVFWGVAEPVYHFAGAPFTESGTPQAATEAMRASFFHWGLHPWSFYGVVAMALAYFSFRKGLPGLISSTFYPILGEEGVKGPIGKTIDIIAVVCTLFGVATSLGLGVMQINGGLNFVYGLPNTIPVSLAIVAIITCLFTISAVTGINKGIKWLSNMNMVIAFILLIFFLFAGPTRYLLNMFTESLGYYIQNIVWLSFFLDTQGEVAARTGYDWVGAWPVFYWAWWITWAPFVGSFIARISRGRTVKEFVMGILVAPTLLSFLWFTFLGGTAIHMELFDKIPISEAVFSDVTSALFVTFNNLPMGQLFSLIAIVMIITFFVTSADSATFVVGMMTSGGNLEPKSTLKVFWGILLGFIAAMLLITGGLDAVKTVALAIGFPFTVLMMFMMYSLFKGFRHDKAINSGASAVSVDNNKSSVHHV